MAIKKAKIYITLNVDTEEYPVPADEQLGDDIQDQMESFIYDIDGLDLESLYVPDFHNTFGGSSVTLVEILEEEFRMIIPK